MYSDVFTPYSYAPPWSSVKPGFYSIFGGLSKRLLDVTCQSAIESSVVSSLPDITFTPTPCKHGEELSIMKSQADLREMPHMRVIEESALVYQFLEGWAAMKTIIL